MLQNPWGGGKSTLAALLVFGLRDPASGLLLAGGFDRQTLDEAAWREAQAAPLLERMPAGMQQMVGETGGSSRTASAAGSMSPACCFRAPTL